MDCINSKEARRYYKELLDKGHTITTLTTAVNQFKKLYGEDAIPSFEWLASNSAVKNEWARKESGFGSASKVSGLALALLRARIGRRNDVLYAKGINRVYSCPDTYLYGDTYKVELVQEIRPLQVDAKMQRLSEAADMAGKYNTTATESLHKAIAANQHTYKATTAPKNARFNLNKNIAKEFAVDVNHRNFDTVSGKILDNTPDFDLPVENTHRVDYNLRTINIFNSDRGKQILSKGLKNNWSLDKITTELAIPKEQKELLLNSDGNTLEEKLVNFASNYSYSVEIKTGKNKLEKGGWGSIGEQSGEEINSSFYSNLTVPGGTNYTENEISTPLITPSIKGHARFSTHQGIGWFRSDEKAKTYYDSEVNAYIVETESTGDLLEDAFGTNKKIIPTTTTKTRRILEIQSDLFQKGRDKKELIRNTENIIHEEFPESSEEMEYLESIGYTENGRLENGRPRFTKSIDKSNNSTQNKFLQLLNKDNNWVTFFVKSIIQDSAKKGYEKVLFPRGETAAKIEGHETIANELQDLNRQIQEIRDNTAHIPGVTDRVEKIQQDKIDKLEQRKSELKSQGIEKLKPIEAFYEIRVTNVLNKYYKNNIKVITDEYGNQWNEITIDDKLSDSIDLMADEGYTRVEEDDFNSLFDPAFKIKKEDVHPAFTRVEEDTYEQLSTEVIAKSPAAIIRESKDERFYQLAKNMQSKTSYHYRRYQEFNTKIRNHESGKKILSEQALEIAKKNAAREYHEIQKTENQRLDIIKFKALEEIELVAEQQLTEMSKMLDKDSVTLSELSYMYDLANTWIDARAKHIFFSDEEKAIIGKDLSSIKPILDKFDSWHTRALEIKDRLNTISAAALTRIVKEEFNNSSLDINPNLTSLSKQDLKDIDYITKMTIDIAEYGNDVLTMLSKLHKKASYASQRAAEEVVKDIDDMVKAANPILKEHSKAGSRYDILMQNQSNTDSRKTGNLVDMNTQKYWNAEKEHNFGKRSIFRIVKSAFQWMKENEMIFDPRILFDDTVPESAKQKHIKELKEHLGEVKYAKLYALAKRRVESYKENLKVEREVAEETYDGNMALVEEFMAMYEKLNSPYKIAEYIEKGYTFDRKFTNNPVLDHIVRVPRKTINGVETGYYDNKYDVIYQEGNEALAELYEYTLDKMEELKQLIPHYNVDLLQRNVLPEAQASIIEMFARGGLKGKGMLRGLAAMWSTVRSQLSTTEDELSDTQHKTIQTKLNNTEKQQIKKYVNLMSIQYKRDNPGEKITKDMISEWTKDITSQIAGYKSFDLSKNLKAFALNCLSYYHKEQMEGIVQIAQKYIDANNDEGQINNIKQAINYFSDTFYGYPDKKKEIKMAGKVTRGVDAKGNPIKAYRPGMKAYSKIEKILKDKIVKEKRQNERELKAGTITEEIFKARQDVLNKYLDETGSVPTLSQHADQLLKYVQYVGMGWNITAGISNFLFGGIANIIESGDGRLFNQNQLMKAYGMVAFESGVLKTTTVGILKTEHAQKITALMKRLDTLKEMKYELITKSPTTSSKLLNKLNFLNPMKIQSATEFLNQAPVLIASLMNINIVDKDGKTDSLWNALNNKGNLKENFRTPENLKNYEGDYMNSEDNKELYKVKARIDEAVKIIHGNYDPDSPLLFKRFWLGRALGQFRRWMPMSFRDRFGAEHYNQLTDMTRKGRYKSGLTVGGAGLSFIPALFGVPPIIGATAMTLLGGTISYSPVQDELNRKIKEINDSNISQIRKTQLIEDLKDSVGFEWGGKRHTGVLAQTLFQTEYLLKKLTFGLAFKGADYKKFGFSEVDAANLKKNLNELLLLTLLQILKGFAKLGDDDDEKSDYEFFVNIALNQLNRMEMDLQLYTSPSQFIGIAAGRVMPVMKLLDQYLKLQQILNTYGDFYANGKSKKNYVRGINKGRNKLEVWAQQAIPGWAQIDKTKKLGEQVMTGQAYKH